MNENDCHMEKIIENDQVHTFMVKCDKHLIDGEKAYFNIQLCLRTIEARIFRDVGACSVKPAMEKIGETLKHTGCNVYFR